ncbi:MAG TPA: type I-MYXAN CRISPR-associated protein Cas6/Cmx6 [Polyangiaceae bacterium]|nr:type I-MYXAN CRISPR-associated protein Cas6/Cmx6 [Polyangiaceae bacterium]
MTTVDLSFPLVGERVPRDHGYALYGALCRVVQSLHTAPWLGVHPLSGTPADETTLQLGRHAQLRLRLPAERIGEVLTLAGSRLDVGGAALRLGAPRVHTLAPRPSLDARMVAIKLTHAPRHPNGELGRETLDVAGFAERYTAEIRRQLDAIGIGKPFELRGRRSVTVAGRRVVGYSVRVIGLSADESIALQEKGIGGKRRMGCGLFRGTRGP